MLKIFVGISALACFATALAQSDAPIVRTEAGVVRGGVDDGIAFWKGIPFAAPPVGPLRWRAPQPARRWSGVLGTTAFGHDCMQQPIGIDTAALGTEPAEDCLYLNVWKPARAAARLPVVVWIHGGGFVNGGSSTPICSGTHLARKGVMVVSFNYRLGRFGTFAHPALIKANEDGGLGGNFGFLDQIAALKWVRRNIAAFGGDPANVTMMGESAGGMSAHMILTSPMSRNLVERAVIMSGGDGEGMAPATFASAQRIGAEFMASKGISADDPLALGKMRALSRADVIDNLSLASMARGPDWKRTFSSPYVDGRVVVDVSPAYRAGAYTKVPIMIGATSLDIGGNNGAMIMGARSIGGEVARQAIPVYAYRFSYVAQSVQSPGARHATDVPFFFDTQAIRYGAATTPRDNAMGEAISSYVVNFARTGNPNASGLPEWPRYDPAAGVIMDFALDGAPRAIKDPLLLEDAAARAEIERHAPGLLANPDVRQRGKSTLSDLQSNFPSILTPAVLAAMDTDLGALPPSASAIEQVRKATAEVAASPIDAAAPWITHPAAHGADFRQEPIALQFRRSFDLVRKPARMRVRVSADQRFILYVNGRRVAAGPARGDLEHYRYEMIDLAPNLAAGRNIVAAQVWSDGKLAPMAEVSTGHTGFMLQAEEEADRIVDSAAGWEVRVDTSRTLSSGRLQLDQEVGPTYYVAGPPERHDAARQLGGWNTGADGGDWTAAVAAVSAGEKRRILVPDTLPQMRYDAPTIGKVVRVIGTSSAPAGPVTIRPGERAAVLYDLGRVMAGYPVLVTSGGKGREVTLTYSEALYDPGAKGPGGVAVRFADRARVADGRALGLTDTFVTDGGKDARFEPLWWRVGRYVEIRVAAGPAPLTLDRLEMRETGYPFEQRGSFVSDDAQLNRIWRTGWKTALLNAHETYMDTAYWEQLQYVGDTRLQMLISYAVAGDPRLAVQALDAFDQSRVVEGIPQSAYPSRTRNPIPPFALLWINTLHDYWMREPDTAVLKRTLPGARAVLDWYAPYLRKDGILRMTPGWLFVDWRPTLSEKNPRNEQRPDSCIITILYYGALRDAADLEAAVGDPALSTADGAQAARVRDRLMDKCWTADRQLFADTPAKTGFSQHANALAVLYDLVPKEKQKDVLQRITTAEGIDAPDGIIPVTYYFAHYLAEAFDHAGMADRYVAMLQPWRDMVRRHFTTFPENPDPSRSDSHAWSAHPTTGLLTYVAGIHPAKPGFGEVHVEPHLGTLSSVDAAMAHPLGMIETHYAQNAKGLSATIKLPSGLRGDFVWKGQSFPLHGGRNQFDLK